VLHAKGIFLLDIEIELAWGVIDQEFDKDKITREAMKARRHLDDIFALLENCQIPTTWGVLGHAALDHCSRDGMPHSNMPRPSYK
jgi:hypothetical protein